jgi:hypothetical protein
MEIDEIQDDSSERGTRKRRYESDQTSFLLHNEFKPQTKRKIFRIPPPTGLSGRPTNNREKKTTKHDDSEFDLSSPPPSDEMTEPFTDMEFDDGEVGLS